jgi:hypothetical protein
VTGGVISVHASGPRKTLQDQEKRFRTKKNASGPRKTLQDQEKTIRNDCTAGRQCRISFHTQDGMIS